PTGGGVPKCDRTTADKVRVPVFEFRKRRVFPAPRARTCTCAVDPSPIRAAIVCSIEVSRGRIHAVVRYEHQPTGTGFRKCQATVLNPLRLTQIGADPRAPAIPRSKNGHISSLIKNGGNPGRL